MSKVLSIGMATFDDYDGVFFTIEALRLYHQICKTDDVEFIILDNNPTGKHAECLKNLSNAVRGKYVPYNEKPSSFNKYKVVDHADGKYIMIVDCHVLLVENALNYLMQYFDNHPNCKDLVQGPLLYDDLQNYSTEFFPQWRGHMYGTWHTNKEHYDRGEPFEIKLQGMGLCAFEKSNWPGINENFRGFGAEEGYIAEKFRQNGGKNICIPQLKWVHRFGRPEGVKYRLILEDRIWNYFIGWLEITRDPEHEMVKGTYEHFKDLIPKGSIDNIFNQAKQLILGEK